MKKLALVVLLVAIAVTTAFAGQRVNTALSVSVSPDGSGSALGYIGTTANSSSTVEYLGCNIKTSGSSTTIVSCYAKDAGGDDISCTSTGEAHARVVSSLNSDSFLKISASATGACTYLESGTSSYTYLKQL